MRLLLALLLIGNCCAGSDVVRFDDGRVGNSPDGWTIAMTHTGGAPQWEIVRDGTAPSPPNVLAQVSRDSTAGRFPLAIWNRGSLRDGEVSVAFKTVAGSIDQAAGIVWRYQDPNNYYIARANAIENNLVLYKVENGLRVSIAPKGLPSRAYGVKHDVPSGRWNRLRVAFKDSVVLVYFNNERAFEAEDHTFMSAGTTGLWTKADSLTYFDDFTVERKQ